MPGEANGALSGAASGAATGTAILPGWGTAIGAVVGGIGGYLSASGTSDAQSAANKAAAQSAAAQSAQSFLNYLSSRGINVQQLIANDPRGADFWTGQYNSSKAAGDKRDFNTWFAAALQAAPTDQIWNAIANPSSAGAAQNTTLPSWAVDANGNPLQPSLLQQLVGIQSGTSAATSPATAPIGSIATVENVHAFFKANPEIAQSIADNMAGSGDTRTPEQWLVDHITGVESKSGGGTYTDYLRNFLTSKAAGGTGVVGNQISFPGGMAASTGGATGPTLKTGTGGTAGAGSNLTLDPAIQALLAGASKTVGQIQDGTMLNDQLAALKPIADARNASAAASLARVNELRGLSGDALKTELGGIADVSAARTAGASSIRDATVAGAGTMRSAAEAAAQQVHDANVAHLAELLGVKRETAQSIYDSTVTGATGVADATKTAAQGVYDTNVDKLAAVLGVRREAAQQIFDATSTGATNVRDATNAAAQDVYNTNIDKLASVLGVRRDTAQQIFDATSAGATGVRDATKTAAQGVYDTNVDKLASLLGVRRDTASQIYDATTSGASGLRDARKAGAEGIYGAESLKADSYAQSTEQALSRALAQNSAERLRRGFTGGSSGANITDARLRADELQQGAGARAQAGVNLQTRLSDAGTGFATDVGQAGIGKATALGSAADSDALARMAAALQLAQTQGGADVNLASNLGAAGVSRTAALGSASESDTLAKLAAALQLATAQGGANVNLATNLGNANVTKQATLGAASESDAISKLQAAIQLATTQGGADVGLAGNIGNAGIARSTGLGAANESDATSKLNAAVELARSLGLAGTNYAGAVGNAGVAQATTLASSGEQAAIAQLQAKVADATRRLGYLTSDADIAAANADLTNAQDALAAITANQNRQISAVTSPFNLAGADLTLKQNLTDQQYVDIDALLKRLNSFSTTPASGPALTTSTPGSVLNGSQIAGGALTGIGSAIGSQAATQSLADLIKQLTASGAGAATTTAPAGSGLLSSGNYLSGASVFQMPKTPGG